jgi:hypothetical protein
MNEASCTREHLDCLEQRKAPLVPHYLSYSNVPQIDLFDRPTALQAVVQVAGDTGYLIYSCSLPVTSVTDWQAATAYNRLKNIVLSRAKKLKEENMTFFFRML